ncbi:MAG: hypothetical protein COA94_06410 [Rickettsiales bacterium]|nr:MAG: hypothetical protein COA94_06410 [Rickettsiales bacterium]
MSGIVTYEGVFKFGEGNVYLTVSFSMCIIGKKVEIMNLNVAYSKTQWGDERSLISTDSELNAWLEVVNNPLLSEYPNYTTKELAIFLVAMNCAAFYAQNNCSGISSSDRIEYKISPAKAESVADSLKAAGFAREDSKGHFDDSSIVLFTRAHDELPLGMELVDMQVAAEIIEQWE